MKEKRYIKVTRDGKVFHQLREVKVKEESKLKEHLHLLQSITSGKQQLFFEWQFNNSKECKVEKTPKEIKKGKPQIKQCYQNSVDVVLLNENVKYCEGFVLFMGIPIEHAWNKIDDKYFDVTSDFALKDRGGLKGEEYLSIVELSKEELRQVYKRGDYQSITSKVFIKKQNI